VITNDRSRQLISGFYRWAPCLVTPNFASDGWNSTDVRALCLREACRIPGASSTADDAAQEPAIRAWRPGQRCRDPARSNSWLSKLPATTR
jgi:hypothetical protein